MFWARIQGDCNVAESNPGKSNSRHRQGCHSVQPQRISLTQMEEIAEEAEVSKVTLYYYFKNKVHPSICLAEQRPEGNRDNPPPEILSQRVSAIFCP
jgi:hypothetical protein